MAEKNEILFQLDEDVSGVVSPQASSDAFTTLSEEQIKDVIAAANRVARCGAGVMQDIGPDGAEIEFGIQAGGEEGVPFVTRGTSGAHFKITMSWKKA